MNWPNDIDGDVFRRLESHGFNFSNEHEIDINIDFDNWPLSQSTVEAIKNLYPNCIFVEPDEEDIANGDTNGYVQFCITAKLTYDLITTTQKEVTKSVEHYGGWCDSWGIESN